MKRMDIIKRFGISAIALALCASVSVGVTLAYYTDATVAEGSLTFAFDDTPNTQVWETPDGTNKRIAVENLGEAPVLVRVKVLYSDFNATVSIAEDSQTGWVHGADGWMYYSQPLWGHELTSELVLKVDPKEGAGALEEFNVTVIEQYAPLAWNAEYESYAGTFVAQGDQVVLALFTRPVAPGDGIAAMGGTFAGFDLPPANQPDFDDAQEPEADDDAVNKNGESEEVPDADTSDGPDKPSHPKLNGEGEPEDGQASEGGE